MTAGRVRVNGEVASELGTKVDPARDEVTVDGRPVSLSDRAAYLMLNKPAGYLTTMRDPRSRPCVAALVPAGEHPGLFPVGRLDLDTTGLLLFTTDGDLAQRLLHPSGHVWKTYVATVDGIVSDAELDPLRAGIELDDGPCRPARCRVLSTAARTRESVVEVVIHEGRKNQVKRMLGRIRHPVLALHRERFGPLALGDLPPGRWRALTGEEISRLNHPEGSD